MPDPTNRRRRHAAFLFSFFVLSLSGCAKPDPDDPGVDKPAVAGVVTGDIKTRRQLADAIEARNKENDARRASGDWRYAKPAVGPAE